MAPQMTPLVTRMQKNIKVEEVIYSAVIAVFIGNNGEFQTVSHKQKHLDIFVIAIMCFKKPKLELTFN